MNFTDKANIANKSQRSRSLKGSRDPTSSAPRRWAYRLKKVLPGRILTWNSSSSCGNQGSVPATSENLQTNVAAPVTGLPNGNLVVEGSRKSASAPRKWRIDRRGYRATRRTSRATTPSVLKEDRHPGPHRLWRRDPDLRLPAAALQPGDGHPAAILNLAYKLPHHREQSAMRCISQPPSAPLAEAAPHGFGKALAGFARANRLPIVLIRRIVS